MTPLFFYQLKFINNFIPSNEKHIYFDNCVHEFRGIVRFMLFKIDLFLYYPMSECVGL